MFRSRLATIVAVGCLATTGVLAVTTTAASAATTFTVDNADDIGPAVPANCTTPVAGACGFNDAIAAAEATGGDVIISLAVPGGVVNSTGDVWNGAPGDTLTIEGNGQSISTTLSTQVVRADSGDHLTIDNVTLESGYTTVTTQVPVTVTNSTLRATVTEPKVFAQGIIADVDVTVSNTSITATNESDSSAIGIQSDHGPITLTDTAVSALSLEAAAVGVQSNSGDTLLTRSTVTASGPAGGTGVLNGDSITLVNSTVADSSGYGIDIEGPVTLVYSDVVNNAQLEGATNINAASLTTFGSVIAGAAGANDNCRFFGAGTTSQGYNLSDDPDATSSCELDAATDRVNTNPLLGGLTNNGGPTPTLLPQTGSPLVDAIPATECQSGGAAGITTDQRGLPRPVISPGGIKLGCDIGSVEVQPDTPISPAVVIQPSFTG